MMINKRKKTWLLLSLILPFSLLLAGCDTLDQIIQPKAEPTLPPVQPESRVVIAEGRVMPKDSANLYFVVGGEVAEVLGAEGERVQKGDLLARLGDRLAYDAALTAAELERIQAEQQLEDLKEKAALAASQARLAKLEAENALRLAQEQLETLDTDETQDRIDDARQAVLDDKENLKDAQEEFDKYRDLDQDNVNRKNAEDRLEEAQDRHDRLVRERDQLINDLELRRARVKDAQAVLEQAQRDLEARKDGPDPDQLTLAEARLKNAGAQVSAAQAALERMDLRAPFAGTLTKVDLTAGERLLPNQVVMVLADFSAWYVETTDLTENEVVKISTGQAVQLLPDALPEVTLKGKVESISESSLERSGDVTYLTRILIEDPDPRLRWGMTVEVHFEE